MKPRVIAYIPLFYGREYLRECIKSMEPFVEKILVVYVDHPSQGWDSKIECPESREELKAIALAASDKVEWHEGGHFNIEAEHRSYIYKYSQGFDLAFTLDSDEVVEPKDIEHAFKLAYESDKRYIGINNFVHFWRSFDYQCKDFYQPVRIINLRNPEGTSGNVDMRIYHFSCAQSEKIIRYKWGVSGHSAELRPGWVDNVLFAWTPENKIKLLHPVSLDIWGEAIPFDKTTLPEILKNHPNYNKHIIV